MVTDCHKQVLEWSQVVPSGHQAALSGPKAATKQSLTGPQVVTN